MTTLTQQVSEKLLSSSRTAIDRAAAKFLSLQHPDGYWCALLTADTTLESDYILFQLWLHAPDANGKWNPPSRGQVDRAAQRILSKQNADGGFAIYAKGPSEISASVKAYFALKLAGIAIDDPPLARLRECILSLRRPIRKQLHQSQPQPVRYLSA
jgi:squalene-hopene/tetraprenyl-beta-curcumene cyclase